MRRLVLSLFWIVVISLVGRPGGAMVAAGADGAEPLATHVTGTLVGEVWDHSEARSTITPEAVGYMRGLRRTQTYTWSDPRLPAVKTILVNTDNYPADEPGRVVVFAGTVRLEGPDGYWVGTATGLSLPMGVETSVETYVGSGAYEGLSAILVCELPSCDGYIFEGDLPPAPDLIPIQ